MNSGLLISQADSRPMYLQITEQIRRRIATGDWPAGHELPSIRALAAETQVSVITIKRAYSDLAREGVIVMRQGKGTFVAGRADLRTRLRQRKVDAHLRAAVDVGRTLGFSPDEMTERLRQVWIRKDDERS
jgi:GntR family transcriptional regulator